MQRARVTHRDNSNHHWRIAALAGSIALLLVLIVGASAQLRPHEAGAAGGPEMALTITQGGSCVDDDCYAEVGEDFMLAVDLVQVPAAGYILMQTYLDFGVYDPTASENEAGPNTCSDGIGLDRLEEDCATASFVYTPNVDIAAEFVWPDVAANFALVQESGPGILSHAGLTGFSTPLLTSTYTGIGVKIRLTCPASAMEAPISLLPYNDPVARTNGALFMEGAPSYARITPKVDTITMHCVDQAPGSIATSSQGYQHSCSLYDFGASSDGVKCWGANESGQLGTGDTLNHRFPRTVLKSGVDSLAPGWSHTCAHTPDDRVLCWGANGDGQLGYQSADSCDGDPCNLTPNLVVEDIYTNPVPMEGVESVVTGTSDGGIAPGFTCVLMRADGSVKCWGINEYGQLGNTTTTDSDTPVDVCADAACATNLTGVAALSADAGTVCALMTNSEAKCWGLNDSHQLGLPGNVWGFRWPQTCLQRGSNPAAYSPCSKSPVNVCDSFNFNFNIGPLECTDSFDGADQIDVGARHGCARMSFDDRMVCWGSDANSELADGGGQLSRYNPEYVCLSGAGETCSGGLILENVQAAGASGNNGCALLTNGDVKCWGANGNGEVGNGQTQSFEDYPRDTATGADGLSVGGQHSCATFASVLKCWGYNIYGQVGNASASPNQLTPDAAPFLQDEDGDGCTNTQEVGPDEGAGGLRDPKNPYDYYDVASPAGQKIRDGVIDLPNDFLALVAHFGEQEGVDPEYDSFFDRGAPGSDPWDMAEPDGIIDQTDVDGMLAQFNHNCL